MINQNKHTKHNMNGNMIFEFCKIIINTNYKQELF